MQGFILSVVSNVAVAGALALLALGVTRIWRDPHLAHALWLLVLLKLVTPPIVPAPVPQSLWTSAREIGPEETASTKRLPAPAPPQETRDVASAALDESRDAASIAPVEPRAAASAALLEPADAASAVPVVLPIVWIGLAIWLAGALAWLGVLLRRYLRFSKLLVASAEADGQLRADARRLASVIGLPGCPEVRVVAARIPPLVWSVGRRPVILLPLPVWGRLDAAQRQTVLLHEWAHVRRRDHWVQWFELLVMVLYWWNPLVWWASRQIRQAEEECCDAWVVWALPECRRSYGEALLQTVEFLTESRAVPAVVGNAFGGFPFKRRIEMILKRRVNPKMSWPMWVTVLLLGAIVLPVAAQQPDRDKTPAARESLEERIERLEKSLEHLQAANKTSSEAPDESPENTRGAEPRFGAPEGFTTEAMPIWADGGMSGSAFKLPDYLPAAHGNMVEIFPKHFLMLHPQGSSRSWHITFVRDRSGATPGKTFWTAELTLPPVDKLQQGDTFEIHADKESKVVAYVEADYANDLDIGVKIVDARTGEIKHQGTLLRNMSRYQAMAEQMRNGGTKGAPAAGSGMRGMPGGTRNLFSGEGMVLMGGVESGSLSGLTSKDYPLTDEEADPLASLLKAFGNKHVYVWAYDRARGTASINTTAEGHRRIAALLQLLRKSGGEIHFHSAPLTDQEIQERRLREEHRLRDELRLRQEQRNQ